MPHRTTYFFPRQFPDYHQQPNHPNALDHQKHSQELQQQPSPFNADNDVVLHPATASSLDHEKKSPLFTGRGSITTPTTTTSPAFFPNFNVDHDVTLPPHRRRHHHHLHHHHHHQKGGKKQHQQQRQLPVFCEWLIDKKNVATEPLPPPRASSRSPSDHHGDDREPLLSSHVEQVVDQGFDQQLSFPRVSSFGSSSYATSSYFSGSTVRNGGDVSSTDAVQSATRRGEEDVGVVAAAGEARLKEDLVQKWTESYYLQLNLAKRLTSQTSLVEPVVSCESEDQWCSDVEILSYRLWVVQLRSDG